ncbi:MAG: DUF2461 domain-containing protein [Reichenbachiella sp.]|uniref:DUF2461 domain-containing protein n=1 Tax=Reichenbachiella sp. TaxID=2184521 RepID=UPI003266BCD1
MKYFDQDFVDFFKDLAKNNKQEWFHANKKRYESSIKKPFEGFLKDLILSMRQEDSTITVEPKDCTLRINRDLRFSKDKTPYNLHYSAVVSSTGRKDKSVPGIFLRFTPEEVGIMGGAYVLDKEQLQAVRSSIAENPKAFQQLITDPSFISVFGKLKGEESKRIPFEFQSVFQNEPLVAKKQFYFVATHPADLITSDQLLETVIAHWHAARPLNEYFTKSMRT